MSQLDKEYYTTGEAAKIIGVSFRTIKRWIYAGRIRTLKTAGGHYRIPRDEIKRLLSETEDQFAAKIIDLISKKKVAYLRELQVCLEDEYPHKDTHDKLKVLVDRKKIKTSLVDDHRWYFPPDLEWDDVKEIAEQKAEYAKLLKNYERSFNYKGLKYEDYAEYLVEQALIRAGFTVVAKDTYYFNGLVYMPNRGPGRPRDLDFIAKLPDKDIFVGIEVKNRMEPPKGAVVNEFIEICRTLNLKPLLISRMAHPMTFDVLKRLGGWVVVFKQQFLKPGFPRDALNFLRQIGIPVAVYRWPPDYLVNKLIKAAQNIN